MNVVIIHGTNNKDKERLKKGFPPQNERNWIPWLRKKLEDKKIRVFAPIMPESWNPKYLAWKKEFEKIQVDGGSVLIGHSAGGAFLVRWLGETKKKVKKLILIVPVLPSEEIDWLDEFLNFKPDKAIGKRVGKIIFFTSDNDNKSILESVNDYHKLLGGKLIRLSGRGHFIESHMGTKEFPELLREILE